MYFVSDDTHICKAMSVSFFTHYTEQHSSHYWFMERENSDVSLKPLISGLRLIFF